MPRLRSRRLIAPEHSVEDRLRGQYDHLRQGHAPIKRPAHRKKLDIGER